MSRKLDHIRRLNQQAWALCKKDSPRAIKLARQAQSLISECADAQPIDEYECLKTQTYCLDMLSRPDEALSCGLRANQLAEAIGDDYLISLIQSLLGRIYWHIDDFPTSMDHYLRALKVAPIEKHPELEISLINGLGLVQYGLENYAESLAYFQACLEKAGSDDLTGRADANNNIAYVLHMLGRDREAQEFGLAALALFNRLGTAVGKMETLHSLGAIQIALGDYDQAMTFLQEGIEVSRQNNSPLFEISYLLEISYVDQARGRLDQGEEKVLAALSMAEGINSLTNISLLHERLVAIYKQQQNYRAALEHFEAFHLTNKKIFNDKSDRRIKTLEITHQVEVTRKQADIYRELAGTDFLTGLVNRRRFLEIAEAAFHQMNTDRRQLAILMLDIDHFKSVNDRYGHKAGDEVLAAVASRIKHSLRGRDAAGRYGGEEFIVLVPGSSAEQCFRIAERIRLAVEQQGIRIGRKVIAVTVSLGVACTDFERALPLDDLINGADQALYSAKQQGRNRVVAWASTGTASPAADPVERS